MKQGAALSKIEAGEGSMDRDSLGTGFRFSSFSRNLYTKKSKIREPFTNPGSPFIITPSANQGELFMNRYMLMLTKSDNHHHR
jgi:hypothetical protein